LFSGKITVDAFVRTRIKTDGFLGIGNGQKFTNVPRRRATCKGEFTIPLEIVLKVNAGLCGK